jgi:two-component system chemotaxis response regulator CheY
MPFISDRFVDLRVLLIEDDPQSMDLIRSMLGELGIFHVHAANGGVKAKSLLEDVDKRTLINVVICDWNMPVISGIDLLRHIRLNTPDLPFLMITGQADEESVREARAAGVTGYIRKPFTIDDLRKKLRIIQDLLALRKSSPIGEEFRVWNFSGD